MTPKEPTAAAVTHANVRYHDALAATYDDRMELFHPRIIALYRDLFERFVFSRFPADAPLTALDVGCGTGLLEGYLVPRVETIVAFDVCDTMLSRARAKYPQVNFQTGDAYAMPSAADGSFDIVCGNALLHHLKDYESVLDAMARRVRSGGVLFLGYEPNALAFSLLAPIRALYRKLMPEERVTDVTDQLGDETEALAEYHQFFSYGLSARKLNRDLRARGFEEVHVFYRAEHFLGILQDRLGWRWIDWFPTPLLRLVGPLAINFHLVAYKA